MPVHLNFSFLQRQHVFYHTLALFSGCAFKVPNAFVTSAFGVCRVFESLSTLLGNSVDDIALLVWVERLVFHSLILILNCQRN